MLLFIVAKLSILGVFGCSGCTSDFSVCGSSLAAGNCFWYLLPICCRVYCGSRDICGRLWFSCALRTEVVRYLVRQLVYTLFISDNYKSFHLWWREDLVKHQKVSKYYETDCIFILTQYITKCLRYSWKRDMFIQKFRNREAKAQKKILFFQKGFVYYYRKQTLYIKTYKGYCEVCSG